MRARDALGTGRPAGRPHHERAELDCWSPAAALPRSRPRRSSPSARSTTTGPRCRPRRARRRGAQAWARRSVAASSAAYLTLTGPSPGPA